MDSYARLKQIASWGIFAVFLAGFLIPRVGMLTGPLLGLWFVGTQKPVRGFLWMLVFGIAPMMIRHGHWIWSAVLVHPAEVIGGVAIGAIFGVLPFFFHRLVSDRLPAWCEILPFPLAAVAAEWAAWALVRSVYGERPAPDWMASQLSLRDLAAVILAAVILWLWNSIPDRGRRRTHSLAWSLIFVAAVAVMVVPPGFDLTASRWPLVCVAGCAVLTIWALSRRENGVKRWSAEDDLGGLLQSPVSGARLHAGVEQGRLKLTSDAGEQFPIRDGIPDFVQSQDLAGANGKYNHLYETIGGFYDDSQRVVCALTGMDRDAYVMSYLGKLEVKPGDAVLETSVGTGLNFKYLPAGVHRFGLDLSEAMLRRCRENLRRWKLPGDLFLGNAESLPFADDSFDVVFHVGGINFFNDRGRAIAEMIRVAKPGSLLLIADETEEHVQRAYENIPVTNQYFKGRSDTVAAPVDLVPAEMEDPRVETLARNRFYALTFRKPQRKPAEPHAEIRAARQPSRMSS